MRFLILILIALPAFTCIASPSTAAACAPPVQWSVAAAFDLAANGELPASYPQPPPGSPGRTIPPSLLKAVGWVESGWRQFSPRGNPLVSFDFGYGIMQITSGMAGASGDVSGSISPAEQSAIASNYVYNIAYGARMLWQKWKSTPRAGSGDPGAIEDWYYALWAYNGWGWANNPNNPRFTRTGTPATNPGAFPYQERVFYWIAHPPRDADGNPLWKAVKVTLPLARAVGRNPGPLILNVEHRQPPLAWQGVYRMGRLPALVPGAKHLVSLHLSNTGTAAWPAVGGLAVGYHLADAGSRLHFPISAVSSGILAFGQGLTAITRPVLPGMTVSLRVPVLAPTQPGKYRLVWDLEEGTSTWASHEGLTPRVQTLRVLSASAPLPAPSPSPTATPLEGLQYVADTSASDGTTLAIRQHFAKGWLVFNNGSIPWTSSWTLQHVSGNALGRKQIALPAAAPCTSSNVVTTMRTPKKPGTYGGVWQLVDPRGQRVGDQLTVSIRVLRVPPVPTPTPSPIPTITPIPTMTATATPVG